MKRISLFAAAAAVALVAGAGLVQAQQKVDHDSQKFLTNAMEGDYAEIDVGKLAQQNGSSQAVKDFGAKLVHDHGAHLDKAKQLAAQVETALLGFRARGDGDDTNAATAARRQDPALFFDETDNLGSHSAEPRNAHFQWCDHVRKTCWRNWIERT